MHQTIRASNKWNQEKHVVVTETMDVKDQTTSGHIYVYSYNKSS